MALLPPFYLDAVVAIGADESGHRRWIGTGFLYGNLTATRSTEKDYRLWLITNKHVIKGYKEVYIKFNSATEQKSSDYRLPLIDGSGNPAWRGHPDGDIDIAAISISGQYLNAEKRRYSIIRSDEHVMTKREMTLIGLAEGDGVFVLGFPMGLVAPERQYVICRSGVFGRLRDYLDNREKDYLIDAFVFPGNSGGPVFIRPSAISITGTEAPGDAKLVGVVKSYLSYRETAISMQTGRPRIIFEENSGLTEVEGAQAVIDTVAMPL